MDIINEIWKPITNFEGLYLISNHGRVKSLIGWNGHKFVRREKILKSSVSQNHYACVTLHKDKKCVRKEIHRLVAEAFVPNPNNLPEVLHLDEDMYNNIASNLKWGTQKENLSFPKYKQRISNFAQTRTGNKNPFYGKHHTKETREKLSAIKKEYHKQKRENNE